MQLLKWTTKPISNKDASVHRDLEQWLLPSCGMLKLYNNKTNEIWLEYQLASTVKMEKS